MISVGCNLACFVGVYNANVKLGWLLWSELYAPTFCFHLSIESYYRKEEGKIWTFKAYLCLLRNCFWFSLHNDKAKYVGRCACASLYTLFCCICLFQTLMVSVHHPERLSEFYFYFFLLPIHGKVHWFQLFLIIAFILPQKLILMLILNPSSPLLLQTTLPNRGACDVHRQRMSVPALPPHPCCGLTVPHTLTHHCRP